MTQVFISYSRKDLSFVEQLADDLKNAGLDVWYDVSKLGGGSRWRVEIENALNTSQYVVVVLSPDSIKSEWVEREFIYSSDLNLKIIPLMFRSCKLPLSYVNLNYIDVQGDNYKRNISKLLRALDVSGKDGDTKDEGTKGNTVPPKPPLKLKTQYIALIGGGTIVIAALLGMSLLKSIFPPAPTPTDTNVVTQILPTSTAFTSIPPGRETQPSLTPTETFVPTEEALKTDITDDRGVEMILMPGGEFMMGSNSGDPDEDPVHKVSLDAFYMDKFEVTNTLYKACVDNGICDPPHEVRSTAHASYYGNPEFNDYPVIYVDWYQAESFCEWRGASLPTEAQWEKAARGTDSRVYPWGEGIDCKKANYGRCNSDIVAVGSYESGISPFGIYDLGGNVWEWVSDWYSETYYRTSPENNPLGPAGGTHKVLRGGTWDSDAGNLSTTNRLKFRPAYSTEGIGFRCAKPATS